MTDTTYMTDIRHICGFSDFNSTLLNLRVLKYFKKSVRHICCIRHTYMWYRVIFVVVAWSISALLYKSSYWNVNVSYWYEVVLQWIEILNLEISKPWTRRKRSRYSDQESPAFLSSRIFCELAVLENAQDRKCKKLLVTPSAPSTLEL